MFNHVCLNCRVKYKRVFRNSKFCSRQCCGHYNKKINFYDKEKNPNWKEKSIGGYSTIHSFIQRRLPKPNVCSICKIRKPHDMHNISGTYNQDLSDWEWLCRKCHMEKDGRINRLKNGERNEKGYFI